MLVTVKFVDSPTTYVRYTDAVNTVYGGKEDAKVFNSKFLPENILNGLYWRRYRLVYVW